MDKGKQLRIPLTALGICTSERHGKSDIKQPSQILKYVFELGHYPLDLGVSTPLLTFCQQKEILCGEL